MREIPQQEFDKWVIFNMDTKKVSNLKGEAELGTLRRATYCTATKGGIAGFLTWAGECFADVGGG
jgi:hypothetical protein